MTKCYRHKNMEHGFWAKGRLVYQRGWDMPRRSRKRRWRGARYQMLRHKARRDLLAAIFFWQHCRPGKVIVIYKDGRSDPPDARIRIF